MTLSKYDCPWLQAKLVAPWLEIIAFLLLVDGYSIYGSTEALLHGSSANGYFISFFPSNYHLLYSIAYESIVLALVLFFLHWKGWASEDFKIKLGWGSSFQGVLLLFVSKIGYAVSLFCMLFFLFLYQKYNHLQFSKSTHLIVNRPEEISGWAALVAFSVINAYFEELINMGYLFGQFAAKCGPIIALILTVALRMSCHTYQGLAHVVAAGVVFLIYGVYYLYYRNLWPLILAHIFFDVFPMDFLKMALSLFHHT